MKRFLAAFLAVALLFSNFSPAVASAQEMEEVILETQEEIAVETVVETTAADSEANVQETAATLETQLIENELIEQETSVPVQELLPTECGETESVTVADISTQNVFASDLQQEAEIKEYVLEDLIVAVPEGFPETEELVEGYLDGLFYGRNDISFLGDLAKAKLNTQGQNVYDYFKSLILKVAAGEESSVTLEMTYNQLVNWGGAESYAVSSATEARDACKAEFQLNNVVSALLHDCPFDLYWFDKVNGVQMMYYIGGNENAYQITKIECVFSVVGDFQAAGYDSAPAVNTAKVTSAINAASNAKNIVARYADKYDFDKLKSYKNEIISLVDYNYAADPDQFSTDADPWQLVYVFDGDSSTKVVCEGYSKAFQYLCDMSEFRETVDCYSVTGYLGTSSGAQGHMWNIVTIEGENYLADITNSDTGTVGASGSLFLAGGSGSITNGYTIASTGFVYDKSTINLWGSGDSSILNLADGPYTLCGNGHNEKILPAVPATCTEDGLTEGAVCQRCGVTTKEQETVTAPGHTVETLEAVTATCAKDGLTEGSWCSICKTVLTAQEVIPANGSHDYVDTVCKNCGAIGGICGDNLTWTLLDGVLTISGMGEMDGTPWHEYEEYIVSVAIENGVTSIAGSAFSGCSSLTSIAIPEGVTSIGGCAFSGCSSLTSIAIPEGVTSIGGCAFSGCSSLTSIAIPEGVTSIGTSAFSGCSSLTSINIPERVTSIGHHTFSGCSSLTSIAIPESVTSIGDYAFYECSSLTGITIPNGVTEICDYTFFYCRSLTSITLPEGVTSIGEGPFIGCISLTGITIPESVTSIGDTAFSGCSSISSIAIPEGVTSIGSCAFASTDNLNEIYFCGDVCSIDRDAFSGVAATAYYPAGNATWTEYWMQGYGGTITWKPYCPNGHTEVVDKAVAPTCTTAGLTEGKHCSACGEVLVAQEVVPATGVHSYVNTVCEHCGAIGGSCGENLTWTLVDGTLTVSGTGEMAYFLPWEDYADQVTALVIQPGATTISDNAFRRFKQLKDVTIADTVTSIGSCAFLSCSALETVEVPASVKILDDNAFAACSNLKSIVLHEGLTTIGPVAFEGCEKLSLIEIPKSVTSIGQMAFSNCKALTQIQLPSGVTAIEAYTFQGSGLTSIEIPDSVTTIKKYAFAWCDALSEVSISKNAAEIGENAFAWCGALKKITFQGDAPKIAENAFSTVTANAYYPADNATWTESVMKDYGGDITWNAYSDVQPVTFNITTGNNAAGKPTLKWNAISGAAQYEVYRSTTKTGTYAKVFTTKGTTYTHVSATAGKTYYYKLKVCLTDGTEKISDIVENSCIIPAVTFEITIGNNAEGKPTLKWSAIPGAVQYEVYRSTTKTGTYAKVFTTKGTTYTHVSATAGKTYYYKLKVCLTDGTEKISDIVENSCIIPAVTFEITIGNNAEGKPTLKWTAIPGAAQYEVYRSTTKTGTFSKVFTTKGTTYTHASATAGKTYYYKLKVCLTDGTKKISDVVENSCIIPAVIFEITTGNNAEGKPTLKWTAIPGAAQYEVYRSNKEAGSYTKVFTTKGTTYTNVSAKKGNTYYYKLKVILADDTEEISKVYSNSCK